MRVVSWLSMPEAQREPKTLDALAEQIGVRPATIQRWRDGKLEPLVTKEVRLRLVEHLPDIYEALAEKAAAGSVEHVELFLRVAGEYVPPATSPSMFGETAGLMCTDTQIDRNKVSDDHA